MLDGNCRLDAHNFRSLAKNPAVLRLHYGFRYAEDYIDVATDIAEWELIYNEGGQEEPI